MIICSILLAASVQFFGNPEGRPEYSVQSRRMSGISSMALSPVNGRMWATWYAGKTKEEDYNNYVVLATSTDNGKNWKEVLLADPDGEGPRRFFDPELWVTPTGEMWWTFAETYDLRKDKDAKKAFEGNSVHRVVLSAEDLPGRVSPDDMQLIVPNGVMMCKPTVLADGAWALPISVWGAKDSVQMYVTEDKGRTFTLRGSGTIPKDDQNIEEPMFVQLKDGAVAAYARVKSGVRIGLSRDGGRTWGPFEKAAFSHPFSRFFVRRLKSGNLLLVKHGNVYEEHPTRTDLRAFVSCDDGKTWEGGLLLDPRPWISYPDGQEMADGTIYITYDFARYDSDQHVCFATFTEADALAAKNVSGRVTRQNLITARCFNERCGLRHLDADGYAMAETFKDIQYSKAATNCVLDLSVPAGKGYATLVWLHGGGLTGGRRMHLPGFDLNKFASVAVEYRLVPEGTFTNCVEDAAAAVAWTLDNIALFGGDPKKVFVGGHSAGGWLTYMVGYDPRWLKAHKRSPDELAGLIPLSGQATTHFNVRAFRGDGEPRYAPKIDEWAPLAYVRGGLPPTCIVTGQRGLDIAGRVEENDLMAASLRACGNRMVEYYALDGLGHGSCMSALAPIAHGFMRRAAKSPYHNSLGAPNGAAPSFAYDPLKRCYYGVFHGERDLTLWRAKHVADILSVADRKVVATAEEGAVFGTPKLVRLPDGKWRIYASAPTVACAESKTKDPFDGFGPFVKLDWDAIDPCVFTAADGRTYMAAVEMPSQKLAVREMASPTNLVGTAAVLAEGLAGPSFVTAPNGRVFLSATASDGLRDDRSCVRLLAFAGGAMADAKNWKLLDAPLVIGGNGVWGPGFASFFSSPDGRETWCAFHAMGAPEAGSQPAKLYARIQKVVFDAAGVPVIGIAAGDGQLMDGPSGE